MSSPYDNRGSSRRSHGVWSHWVPLVVTVTVATVGVAAWVWSQRSTDEEDGDSIAQHLDYDSANHDNIPSRNAADEGGVYSRGPPSFRSDLRPDEVGYGVTQPGDSTAPGWGARMSGALRRTPSPQQFLDRAGKTVAAGVAAAGTAVGTALAAIREDDKSAYADHETWSEEADAKKDPGSRSQASGLSSKRRKIVAIVVSADHLDDLDEDGYHEHASILSHIPKHNDHAKVKLFILIYAPGLKDSVIETATTRAPASLSSSFSMVGHEQAATPGDEGKNSMLATSGSSAFNKIYSQAADLVEKEVNVLPFTTPVGYVHILHHLKPEVVYLQESLSGDNGSNVQKLQTWLRYDVILVVGAESGHGGLADSESEAEKGHDECKWWQREERVGRGRGVVVVDSMRVSDDWSRRIQGNE